MRGQHFDDRKPVLQETLWSSHSSNKHVPSILMCVRHCADINQVPTLDELINAREDS